MGLGSPGLFHLALFLHLSLPSSAVCVALPIIPISTNPTEGRSVFLQLLPYLLSQNRCLACLDEGNQIWDLSPIALEHDPPELF